MHFPFAVPAGASTGVMLILALRVRRPSHLKMSLSFKLNAEAGIIYLPYAVHQKGSLCSYAVQAARNSMIIAVTPPLEVTVQVYESDSDRLPRRPGALAGQL